MRRTIFDNPAVSQHLDSHFVCAWQSLRPVPRVEIDFGNGKRLTRTLNGNVATYFCTSRGEVVDIVPGLATPEEFSSRATAAIELVEALPRERAKAQKAMVEYHLRRAKPRSAPGGLPPDAGKRMVQGPIKSALTGQAPDPFVASLGEDAEFNVAVRMPQVHALLAEQPLASPAELRSALFRDILGVDIDDPYLGLAPYVLGGEGGRSH